MARNTEEPVTTPYDSPTGDTRTTHPAFGQIAASRVSGHTALYASDFVHQHYMVVRIATSSLMRGLNRDWHFAGQEFVEVAMTEAQWATFVSSPNAGGGVPCTITRREGAFVPSLPNPKTRVDQFSSELRESMAEAIQSAKKAIAEIDEMGLPKGKAERLKAMHNGVLRNLESNFPFVASQFDEHMENTVEHAKQEIHGYMTSVLMRAGLESLSGPSDLPLMIEGGVSESD
jgi:hypothetical protein